MKSSFLPSRNLRSYHLVPNLGTVFIVALLLFAQNALASSRLTPQGPADMRISYQGRLAGADGVPLAGAYAMTFALYTDASGGSLVWSEAHASVTVNDGLFSVLLGSVTALPDPMPVGNLYLDITVGGEEITPRSLLSSSYHALEANLAATVPDGAVGTAQLADDAVTDAKLASPITSQSWMHFCLTPHATYCGANVVSDYSNTPVGDNQFLQWTLPYEPFPHTLIGTNGKLNVADDNSIKGSGTNRCGSRWRSVALFCHGAVGLFQHSQLTRLLERTRVLILSCL